VAKVRQQVAQQKRLPQQQQLLLQLLLRLGTLLSALQSFLWLLEAERIA